MESEEWNGAALNEAERVKVESCWDGQGVGAVLFCLEVDGQLALMFGADNGIVPVVLRDVESGAVVPDPELGQLATFAEAYDGAVDDAATLAEVEDQSLAVVVLGLGSGRMWRCFLKLFIY